MRVASKGNSSSASREASEGEGENRIIFHSEMEGPFFPATRPLRKFAMKYGRRIAAISALRLIRQKHLRRRRGFRNGYPVPSRISASSNVSDLTVVKFDGHVFVLVENL